MFKEDELKSRQEKSHVRPTEGFLKIRSVWVDVRRVSYATLQVCAGAYFLPARFRFPNTMRKWNSQKAVTRTSQRGHLIDSYCRRGPTADLFLQFGTDTAVSRL